MAGQLTCGRRWGVLPASSITDISHHTFASRDGASKACQQNKLSLVCTSMLRMSLQSRSLLRSLLPSAVDSLSMSIHAEGDLVTANSLNLKVDGHVGVSIYSILPSLHVNSMHIHIRPIRLDLL